MYDKIKELNGKIDGKIGNFMDRFKRNNGSREVLVKKFVEDYKALVSLLKEAENIWFKSEEDLEKIKIYLEQKKRKYDLFDKKIFQLPDDVGFDSLNRDILSNMFEIRDITGDIIREVEKNIENISLEENLLPEMSDEVIDLFFSGEDLNNKRYLIFLHGTNICVGNISHTINHEGVFSSRGPDYFFGDVGYSILPEFRGNNYSLSALSLLAKKLYDDGVKEFFLTAHAHNIPSIKIIEKFGGVMIKRPDDRAVCYKADLEKIFKNEKSPAR